MIRSPMEILKERTWETAAVSFAVIVVLGIPLGLALVSMSVHRAAEQWLSDYTPIVYMASGTDADDATSLSEELAAWPLVAQAEVRSPEQAHAVLVEQLGDELVTELHVTPGMLPTSIVLVPSVPVAGHIDLVSRVAGLEARMEVESVEVPGGDALRAVHFAGVGGAVAALLGLFGVLSAAALLLSFFERLRNEDDETDRVLALFGARPGELRRPTLVRGLAVGAWCGAAVSIGGSAALLAWQLCAPAVVGVDFSTPLAAWMAVCAPLLIVPALGFAAAWKASRRPVQIWRRVHA